MKFSMSRIFGWVALAGLVGACSSSAALQARFHLPVAASWGRAHLAPGDYQITLARLSAGTSQMVIRGAGNTIYAMPVATDDKEVSKPSCLRLVEVGGNYFVQEYSSKATGKTFTFAVPKQIASTHARTIDITN